MPNLALARPYIVKIGHSAALAFFFMSYLDAFKKKPTVFAGKLAVEQSGKCCKVKEMRWSNAPW